MVVHVKLSALKEGRWYEYLVRFALGGVATVVAGVVADIWGPAAGGLFLAFPAIFCASATLIEKHERERKEKKGLKGKERGKNAAALGSEVSDWPFLAPSCGASLKRVQVYLWLFPRSSGLPLPSCCGERGGRS